MTVVIPTSLRKFTAGQAEVNVDGASVAEALHQLTRRHPELHPHLFAADDQLLSFVNVFVNRDNIRDLDDVRTAVSERDEIVLVPAIAGG